MAFQLLLPTLIAFAVGAQSDEGTKAIVELSKRIDDLYQVIGETAPRLCSEKDCQAAKKQFEELAHDLDEATKTFPGKIWPKLLKSRLLNLYDNLDLNCHSTPATLLRENFYNHAIISLNPSSQKATDSILFLDPGEISYSLPNENTVRFSFISFQELLNRYKTTNAPISVSIIHPAKAIGPLIQVVIEHRVFQDQGTGPVLAIECWTATYFRLDQEINKYYLFKTKNGCI